MLTAADLWPLVQKLPPAEQLKLARMALRANALDDAAAYPAQPPLPDELGSDETGLDWEAEGWDELDASR